MALAKAQESIAIRILFPHCFQGGIQRIADHHVIAKTGPASMLASMSVAMPEQIEKPHSSSFS